MTMASGAVLVVSRLLRDEIYCIFAKYDSFWSEVYRDLVSIRSFADMRVIRLLF